MRLGRALLVGLVLVGCGPLVPELQPDDVARAAARWPDSSAEQLERGRALYLARCTACHRPVAPASVAIDRWPEEIAKMRKRASLAAPDDELLLRYLVTVGSRPR